MTIHGKAVVKYFTVVLFVFQFYTAATLKLSVLDFALSGVKGLKYLDIKVLCEVSVIKCFNRCRCH